MKKRGFGQGHWNGVGGKVHPGESLIAGAIRETHEEIGVKLCEDDMSLRGTVRFYFDANSDWNQDMHIFVVKDYTGAAPIESEEMRPEWFELTQIPYSDMWADDVYWLPRMLAGEHVSGTCFFHADGSIREWSDTLI